MQCHKYKCENELLAAILLFFFLIYILLGIYLGPLPQLFIKITLKQLRRTNLTCSLKRKNWILQYLLHEVLCPLNHKVNVVDLEATLEVLKELLEEVHFEIARLHLHRTEWQVHQLIHVLHSSGGKTGFEKKQLETNFK